MAAHQAVVEAFLNPVREPIVLSVRSYAQDGRNRLSVAIGCTRGQHRSVYCAEALAAFLRASGDCDVELVHLASGHWKT